jgi:hypothetical protein
MNFKNTFFTRHIEELGIPGLTKKLVRYDIYLVSGDRDQRSCPAEPKNKVVIRSFYDPDP